MNPIQFALRARQAEATIPALVATIGSALSGVAVGFGLFEVASRGRQSAGAVFTP